MKTTPGVNVTEHCNAARCRFKLTYIRLAKKNSFPAHEMLLIDGVRSQKEGETAVKNSKPSPTLIYTTLERVD